MKAGSRSVQRRKGAEAGKNVGYMWQKRCEACQDRSKLVVKCGGYCRSGAAGSRGLRRCSVWCMVRGLTALRAMRVRTSARHPLEVGQQQFQTARDRVDVPRLREQGQLRVEPRQHGQQRWGEWGELYGRAQIGRSELNAISGSPHPERCLRNRLSSQVRQRGGPFQQCL